MKKLRKQTMTSDQLRGLLSRHGLTQCQFAEAIGVSCRTIERYCSSDYPIKPAMVLLIKKAFESEE